MSRAEAGVTSPLEPAFLGPSVCPQHLHFPGHSAPVTPPPLRTLPLSGGPGIPLWPVPAVLQPPPCANLRSQPWKARAAQRSCSPSHARRSRLRHCFYNKPLAAPDPSKWPLVLPQAPLLWSPPAVPTSSPAHPQRSPHPAGVLHSHHLNLPLSFSGSCL